MGRTTLAAIAVLVMAGMASAEPFLDSVVTHTIGTGGGGRQADLPGIVLGPPRGGGAFQGSLDVVSLGLGGTITVAFDDNVVVDGPGPDLLVFENPFLVTGATTNPPFAEPATIELSGDGIDWHTVPCAIAAGPYYAGCAGVYPVLANAGDPNAPSPLVPSTTPIQDLVGIPVDDFEPPAGGGGDAFDLASVGLAAARYVRVTASTTRVPGLLGLAGFDLDAMAAVHSVDRTGAPDVDGDGYPDAADACPDVFDPQQRDADGDGVGDVCEDGGGDCAGVVEPGTLTLTKLHTAAADDGIAWKGTLRPFLGTTPDPATTGVRVRLADASGTLLDATIPGGLYDKASKTGWKVKKTTFTWKGAVGGVTAIKVIAKVPGELALTVTGKGASLPAAPVLPLEARLTVDARCGETVFAGADCVAQASKGKVVCK